MANFYWRFLERFYQRKKEQALAAGDGARAVFFTEKSDICGRKWRGLPDV